jgi:hypothetical protein
MLASARSQVSSSSESGWTPGDQDNQVEVGIGSSLFPSGLAQWYHTVDQNGGQFMPDLGSTFL